MPNIHKAVEEFVTDFRHMEYALKRSGYLRKNKDIAEADWDLSHYTTLTNLIPVFRFGHRFCHISAALFGS